ncbi:MAG: FHA domain-containing protein, partial [Haloarculaceae archaeon]
QGQGGQQGGRGQGGGASQGSGGQAPGDRQDRGQSRGGGQVSGGGAGAGRDGRGASRRYDTVVFEVEGKEIRASPGDTVGREIRTAMVEQGAPKDDAVYVHREHCRVEREDGTFYLLRLGQNSLKVNGEPVERYERAPVESGDTASFSEVVEATVHLE